MLRVAVPKGSLEESTFRLFKEAGLPIARRSKRGYDLKINDTRISEALLLRPQEIPKFVQDGEFDLGICGLDWIIERGADVEIIQTLGYSKQNWSDVKIVLAVDNDGSIKSIEDIRPTDRVITEYPQLTRQYFTRIGKRKVKRIFSYGATEAKVPRFGELLVDVTETGETLKRNNKRIIDVILVSSTKLIANKKSYQKPEIKKAIDEITLLLKSVIDAVGKVLIKMNIKASRTKKLINTIECLRPPTISPVYFDPSSEKGDEKWQMVETVVAKGRLNTILPQIQGLGAEDIVEMNIDKMIQ